MDAAADDAMYDVVPASTQDPEGEVEAPPPDQIDSLYHSTKLASAANGSRWEETLNNIIPAIVSIRFIAVRNFDTEHQRASQASGFVVDKVRGIVLSNRHVVQPGPILAEAILNHSKEEIKLIPIYRDPGPSFTCGGTITDYCLLTLMLAVHDFGFYRFDVSTVKYMKVVEIPLAPERARVGIDIRVVRIAYMDAFVRTTGGLTLFGQVGNDSGERLSILSGTLARLDRKAPYYGNGKYNDWNTFYYQAASMTSGGAWIHCLLIKVMAKKAHFFFPTVSTGSSGSPVIDVEGNAIALNAGGAMSSASSFFLPLDRVVRVLRLIQNGEPVPRGTIQTVFKFTTYDELKRLGLDPEAESAIRGMFPDSTGMLAVGQVIPSGPADRVLESGDILLKINGTFLVGFVTLEDIIDSCVGKTVMLHVQRGSLVLEITLPVQDLHSITPNRFVEVGGGTVNELSYQMARSFMVPAGGVYVAGSGYMFGLAGVSRKCVITSLNNIPTPNLDVFVEVMKGLKDNERVPIRYYQLGDINKEKLALIQVDRRWHAFRMAVRNDSTGLWDYIDLPPCIGEDVPKPHTASHISLDPSLGPARSVIPSLVHVEFHLPFKVDGVVHQVHSGIGLVVSAEMGYLLVDRHTVPTSIGDILLTFANSIIIPGQLVYLHQLYNFAVVRYDVSLLGETFVQSAPISDKPLNQGDSVYLVCLTKAYQPIVRRTVVTNVRQFFVNEPIPPSYRAMNVEGIELENPISHGGVLTDSEGKIQALYAGHTRHSPKGRNEFFMGLGMELVMPAVKAIVEGHGNVPTVQGLEVELTYAQVAHARILGLSDEWVKRIEGSHLSRRNVLVVRRLTSGTEAGRILREGDVVLAVNGDPATKFTDVMRHTESESLDLTILRDRKEMVLKIPTSIFEHTGTERVVVPHKAVFQQMKNVPKGTYVVYDGSPSQLYALHPLTWVTEVNGQPTETLDAFLNAVSSIPSDVFVRLKTVNFTRFVKVTTIRTNRHYFGTWEIVKDENHAGSRAMKLTIKTLQQKTFSMEVDTSLKISDIKKRIEEDQGFPVAHQKLIHSGKILNDDTPLQEYNITEKDFLVVMVTKPKATPSAASSSASSASQSAPAAAPAPAPTPAAPSTPAAAPAAPAAAPAAAQPAEAPAASAASFDASTLATGSAYASAVQNLVEMGFERDQVVRAMRAAFNNPDRAAEYLMTGIPEHVTRDMGPAPGAATGGAAPPAAAGNPPAQAAAAAPATSTPAAAGGQPGQYVNLFEAAAAAAQQQQGGGGGGGAGGAAGGDLSFLRNTPQFQQLRQLVRTQPQLLQPLLQQLAQSQPELVQMINQNPDQFLQLLGEGGDGGAEGDAPPGAQYVSVTPEEEAAINRLAALGFDRALAIEAFFACDKNEELAANYLFDHGNEGDWQ
ncbi:serine protease [Borealophlyctis nickersoniae]|nr:serine protease [Borealophlyctis nickersoniae]